MGIKKLPASLEEALWHMTRDSVVTGALGEHVLNNYVKAKRIEWEQFKTHVHPWEVAKYLIKY